MPTFQIEGPDGKFEITAPDEATAIDAFKKQTAGGTFGDVLRSGAKGLAEGFTGILDLPANIPGYIAQGGSIVGEKLGMIDPDKAAQFRADISEMSQLGGAGHSAEQVAPGVMGYQPNTPAGEIAETAGSFLGGGLPLGGTPAQMIGAGVGSEVAGQMTEGSKLEPWARIGGALLAPVAVNVLENAGRRALTPYLADPDSLKAAEYLKSRGVNVTAGQKTGSPVLQYREAIGDPRITVKPLEEFTAAAMKGIGSNSARATDDALAAQYKVIGGMFDDVALRTNVKIDQKLIDESSKSLALYKESVGSQASMPKNIVNEIYNLANTTKIISGEKYQEWASRLGKLTKSADPTTRDMAIELRGSIDAALQRSASGADVAKILEARRLYRNFLIIERAASRTGVEAAKGLITPGPLGTATKAIAGTRNYTLGKTELGPLSRQGTIAFTPPHGPEASIRNQAVVDQALGTTGLGAATFALSGGNPIAGATGAAIGTQIPRALNNFAGTPAGQRFLGNQVFGPGPSVLDPRYGATLPGLLATLTR
jgi:hypothetical protein